MQEQEGVEEAVQPGWACRWPWRPPPPLPRKAKSQTPRFSRMRKRSPASPKRATQRATQRQLAPAAAPVLHIRVGEEKKKREEREERQLKAERESQ